MAKKKTKKKKQTTGRQIFSFIGILLLLTGIVASAVAVWCGVTMLIDAYNFDISDYKMDIASIIYAVDEDGNAVEFEQLHSSTKRLWVDIDKIPKHVQTAAIAIEDERFYSHQGMDLKRTLGAILGYVTGSGDYGGSTITQQLIKNLTDEREYSPLRKLKEIFRALVLETQLEKDEILEYYLNIVYFGNGCNGIQLASHTYFDKDVSELSIAEAASIVGITQRPATFDPFDHPDKNKEKQELVLDKMLELGYINQEEYDEAVAQKLDFAIENDGIAADSANSYFTEAMINEIAEDLAKEKKLSPEQARRMVYSGGLKIYSTVSPHVQSAIEEVFEDSSNTALFPKLSGDVQPQAAMVIISPETGAVLGMVGGVGRKTEGFPLNRAVDTVRQPGSSIKPLTAYGPAIELNLLSPGSILKDEPYEKAGWKPQNWYKGFKGNVTVREAVVQSMNIPAIKTVETVGVNKSFDFAKNKLRLSSLDESQDKNLSSLALGGMYNGVSVKNMTAAYGAFANKGIYTEPYTYTKVVDSKGKILLEKEIVAERVFSEQTAYLMTSVLKSTAEGSLGRSAAIPGMVSAGKTGTTNDDKDRWYIGYTPYYLGGVWYGYDIPKTVPYNRTSVVAHKLWKAVMTSLHKDLKNTPFEKPAGIVSVSICKNTGNLAVADICPAYTEEFKKGATPKFLCSTEGHEPTPTPEISPAPDGTTDGSASPDPSATPSVGSDATPSVPETSDPETDTPSEVRPKPTPDAETEDASSEDNLSS